MTQGSAGFQLSAPYLPKYACSATKDSGISARHPELFFSLESSLKSLPWITSNDFGLGTGAGALFQRTAYSLTAKFVRFCRVRSTTHSK